MVFLTLAAGRHIPLMFYWQLSFLTPPHGKCGQQPLRYLRVLPYTKQLCLMECEIGFAFDECGCLPAVLPTVNIAVIIYDYPIFKRIAVTG